MNIKSIATTLMATGFVLLSSQWEAAYAGLAIRVADAIRAYDQLYDTVGTDTKFKSPPPHFTGVLYNSGMSGLEGQRSVAESAPGDPDFNGGRWAVTPVVFTDLDLAIHDGDTDRAVDFELTNAEQVEPHAELGHLMIAERPGLYFECPMLPRRGNKKSRVVLAEGR